MFANSYYKNYHIICRCKLKQVANKRHEAEKDYMVTTSTYSCDTALKDDTALETDTAPEGDTVDEELDSTIPADNSATDPTMNNGKPLLFFYDCETTGGRSHHGSRVSGTSSRRSDRHHSRIF